MKNITVSLFVALFSLPLAHANGVEKGIEKVLANDAHDAKVTQVALGWEPTGQTLVSDGVDGPVYDTTYTQALEVTVTYQSSDQTDLPTEPNNDGEEVVVGSSPTVWGYLPATDAEVAAIKAHTLDPMTLVTAGLSDTTVQIENANYQYQCQYDNDSNLPMYGCVEPAVPTHPEQRKLLTVDRK
jgi:hypothetical protein